jgi:2-oxoglutarate dehydrogenase E1 component
MPIPRDIYIEKLAKSGDLEAGLAKEMEKQFKGILQERLNEVKRNNINL